MARLDDLQDLFKVPAGSGGAYRMLFTMILTQRLDGPVVESRVARDLSAPPRSVRRALLRLADEEMLVRGDNLGFVARRVSLTEYVQSADVRHLAETEAVEIAAARGVPTEKIARIRQHLTRYWNGLSSEETIWRLDDAVHDLMLDHCGNPILGATVRSLRTTIRLFDMQHFERRRTRQRHEASLHEHLEILEALEKGDRRRVRRTVQAHIRSANRT